MASVLEFSQDPLYRTCVALDNGEFIDFGSRFFNPSNGTTIVNLGWVVSMAKCFSKNILMICSNFAFRYLHKGRNSVFLKFGSMPCDLSNTWIIGVSGLSLYHPIDNPSNFDFESYLANDSIITLEYLEELRMSPDFTFRRLPSVIEEESEIAEDFDSNEMTVTTDEAVSGDSNGGDSISIEEAVVLFDRMDIKQKFMSELKIDFRYKSEILKDSTLASVSSSFDCDGIFAHGSASDLSSAVNCPLTITRLGREAWMRDKASFKNTFGSDFEFIHDPNMVKFGTIVTNFGTFDLFAYYGFSNIDGNRSSEIKLLDHLKLINEITAYSLQFQCDTNALHADSCRSSVFRAQRGSSVPLTGLREDNIATELIPCFLYHFETDFYRRFNFHGVKLTFYLRLIGSKSVLLSTELEDLAVKLENLFTTVNVFKLPRKNVCVDFCKQLVPKSVESGGLVRLIFTFLFVDHVLVVNVLGSRKFTASFPPMQLLSTIIFL